MKYKILFDPDYKSYALVFGDQIEATCGIFTEKSIEKANTLFTDITEIPTLEVWSEIKKNWLKSHFLLLETK